MTTTGTTGAAPIGAPAEPVLGGGREPALSEYLQQYSERRDRGARPLLSAPRAAVRALRDVRTLPLLRPRLTSSVEGEAIRHEFTRFRSRHLLLGLSTVLQIPERADSYIEGSSKQTLRRKTRVAKQRGVTWHRVDDPAERAALLVLADRHEKVNERERYRQAEPDNADLLQYRLWLVAEAADSEPLLLSVTPVDGAWATLRYFRTLTPSDDASVARYWMTEVLVQHLSEQGVRYLIDAAVPHWLPNGLRHFQRMLGFRLVRLRLARAPR